MSFSSSGVEILETCATSHTLKPQNLHPYPRKEKNTHKGAPNLAANIDAASPAVVIIEALIFPSPRMFTPFHLYTLILNPTLKLSRKRRQPCHQNLCRRSSGCSHRSARCPQSRHGERPPDTARICRWEGCCCAHTSATAGQVDVITQCVTPAQGNTERMSLYIIGTAAHCQQSAAACSEKGNASTGNLSTGCSNSTQARSAHVRSISPARCCPRSALRESNGRRIRNLLIADTMQQQFCNPSVSSLAKCCSKAASTTQWTSHAGWTG